MNQMQFSKKNAIIKLSGQTNTNFKGQQNSGGIFDELINALKQKDQRNLERTQDVFIKFSEKWILRKNEYKENWKQDLYELYQKENKQKQNEIRNCLFSYIQLAQNLRRSFAFKIVFYKELSRYFLLKYIQSPEYQFMYKRSLKESKKWFLQKNRGTGQKIYQYEQKDFIFIKLVYQMVFISKQRSVKSVERVVIGNQVLSETYSQ